MPTDPSQLVNAKRIANIDAVLADPLLYSDQFKEWLLQYLNVNRYIRGEEIDSVIASSSAQQGGYHAWTFSGAPSSLNTITEAITFPHAFTSAPSVVATHFAGSQLGAGGLDAIFVGNVTVTGVDVSFRTTTDLAGDASGSFYWIALQI